MMRGTNRTHLIRVAWSVGIALLVAACADQFRQQEQALQQPMRINCATAEGDVRMLQNEKAHVAQQIAMGITAITPIGMIAGAATGTEQTKLQVASGDLGFYQVRQPLTAVTH